MKLSCCSYSYRQLFKAGQMTMESFLETCAALGFDGVELTQYFFSDETEAYLNGIKRKVFRLGLGVSGTAVGGDFGTADEAEREKLIDHVCDWLEKSARLGSPCLRVFGRNQPDGVDRETAVGWIRDAIGRCAVEAERHGVVLALENHHGLTADAAGTLDLYEPLLANPWIGINLDCGNFVGDIYEQFTRCASYAVNVHAKATYRVGEARELVDYREVVRVLRDAGYAGYMAIEYEEPEPPLVGVDRFAAYLRGCIVDA